MNHMVRVRYDFFATCAGRGNNHINLTHTGLEWAAKPARTNDNNIPVPRVLVCMCVFNNLLEKLYHILNN